MTKVLQEHKRQWYSRSSVVVSSTHTITKVSLYRHVEGNELYVCGLLRLGSLTPGDVSHVVELCFSALICDVLNKVDEYLVP